MSLPPSLTSPYLTWNLFSEYYHLLMLRYLSQLSLFGQNRQLSRWIVRVESWEVAGVALSVNYVLALEIVFLLLMTAGKTRFELQHGACVLHRKHSNMIRLALQRYGVLPYF
jgi:hypothetical protein